MISAILLATVTLGDFKSVKVSYLHGLKPYFSVIWNSRYYHITKRVKKSMAHRIFIYFHKLRGKLKKIDI